MDLEEPLLRGPSRLPIVGVMGSGTAEHAERAVPLGRWLAHRGVHLLTGAGGGVMTAVSRAFHEVESRRGLVLGIVPAGASPEAMKPGYPNRWVEIPIRTHLPLSGERGADALSRNHINVLTSDVIVALPGGHGTANEIVLAQAYRRPLMAFVHSPGEIPGLPERTPRRASLDEVMAFVEGHLDGGPAAREG